MKGTDQAWKMGKFRLRIYLVALFLVMIPTVTSYFAVRGLLSSTLTLGLDQRIESQLDMAGKNLKRLAKLDSHNESSYKQQFLELQEMKRTYTFLLDTLPSMHHSYLLAFIIALGIGLIYALILATWLNRRIIQSHKQALEQVKASQDRVSYLENQESWRLIAQKLVHEIKNPLTPIQVMVSRLPGKYHELHSELYSELHPALQSANQEFEMTLYETRQIVTEEIEKVNAWIEAFSKYARMPAPRISQVEVSEFLFEFQRIYGSYWEHLKISVKPCEPSSQVSGKLICSFDAMLIKQVLFNLAKNSAEAMTGNEGEFSIEIQRHHRESGVILIIRDNGPGIPDEFKARLFQPNISSKGTDQPRGFGLAIVKKIVVEHGGDIRYLEGLQGCGFEIFLPDGPDGVVEI